MPISRCSSNGNNDNASPRLTSAFHTACTPPAENDSAAVTVNGTLWFPWCPVYSIPTRRGLPTRKSYRLSSLLINVNAGARNPTVSRGMSGGEDVSVGCGPAAPPSAGSPAFQFPLGLFFSS